MIAKYITEYNLKYIGIITTKEEKSYFESQNTGLVFYMTAVWAKAEDYLIHTRLSGEIKILH